MTIDWNWAWLIGGTLLAIGEVVLPGMFLMWIGIAAIVTGVASLTLGITLAAPLGLFAAVTILSVYAGRHIAHRAPIISDDPLLNEGTARLIGRVVTVTDPIQGGEGRVRVGDGMWTAIGPDLPAGSRVEIVRAIGQRLVVEPVSPLKRLSGSD